MLWRPARTRLIEVCGVVRWAAYWQHSSRYAPFQRFQKSFIHVETLPFSFFGNIRLIYHQIWLAKQSRYLYSWHFFSGLGYSTRGTFKCNYVGYFKRRFNCLFCFFSLVCFFFVLFFVLLWFFFSFVCVGFLFFCFFFFYFVCLVFFCFGFFFVFFVFFFLIFFLFLFFFFFLFYDIHLNCCNILAFKRWGSERDRWSHGSVDVTHILLDADAHSRHK